MRITLNLCLLAIVIAAFAESTSAVKLEDTCGHYISSDTGYGGCGGNADEDQALEIQNSLTLSVYAYTEPNKMTLEEFQSYPNQVGIYTLNSPRNLQFQSNCFFKSPTTPLDCEAEDCTEVITVKSLNDTTWGRMADTPCASYYPNTTAELQLGPAPEGSVMMNVLKKCQNMTFEGPDAWIITDEWNNKYIMHASAKNTSEARDEAAQKAVLPPNWSIEKVTLDEPLTITPDMSAGDGSCYYTIIRDSQDNSYHLFGCNGTKRPIDQITCSEFTGTRYRLRLAASRCPDSRSNPEYLGFKNKTCSDPLVGPVLRTKESSKNWKEWTLAGAGFTESGNELIKIKAFNPDGEVKCPGYLNPYSGANSCSIDKVQIKENSSDKGYKWELEPVAGKRNTYHIKASTRTEPCRRYLSATSSSCAKKTLSDYSQTKAERSQWVLESVEDGPPAIPEIFNVTSTSAVVFITPPLKGPAPVEYKLYIKNTKIDNQKVTAWFEAQESDKGLGYAKNKELTNLVPCTTYELRVRGKRSFPATETPISRVKSFKTKCSSS